MHFVGGLQIESTYYTVCVIFCCVDYCFSTAYLFFHMAFVDYINPEQPGATFTRFPFRAATELVPPAAPHAAFPRVSCPGVRPIHPIPDVSSIISPQAQLPLQQQQQKQPPPLSLSPSLSRNAHTHTHSCLLYDCLFFEIITVLQVCVQGLVLFSLVLLKVEPTDESHHFKHQGQNHAI